MKSNISTKRLYIFLTKYLYWIIMLLYLIEIMFLSLSTTTIFDILLILIGILAAFNSKGKIKISLIYLYLLISVGSACLYLFNGIPITLYYSGIAYSILPIMLYIVPKKEKSAILEHTFSAIIFSFIVGLLLYIIGPSHFGDYLVKHGFISRASQVSSSLQGLYGITAIGTFSACATLYYYGKWAEYGKRKYLLGVIFSICILLLSMRRSAVAACFLMLMIESVVFAFVLKKQQKKQVVIWAIVIVILSVLVFLGNEYLLDIFDKVSDVSTAFSERSGNWERNYSIIKKHLLLGTGLGSGGHMASSLGMVGVNDNSYLMMVRENGILGLVTFLSVVLISFIRFFNKHTKSVMNYVSFSIVCVYLIQAIGSNVFEIPISAGLFWLMMSLLYSDFNDEVME